MGIASLTRTLQQSPLHRSQLQDRECSLVVIGLDRARLCSHLHLGSLSKILALRHGVPGAHRPMLLRGQRSVTEGDS